MQTPGFARVRLALTAVMLGSVCLLVSAATGLPGIVDSALRQGGALVLLLGILALLWTVRGDDDLTDGM